jgi:hypothetical protein
MHTTISIKTMFFLLNSSEFFTGQGRTMLNHSSLRLNVRRQFDAFHSYATHIMSQAFPLSNYDFFTIFFLKAFNFVKQQALSFVKRVTSQIKPIFQNPQPPSPLFQGEFLFGLCFSMQEQLTSVLRSLKCTKSGEHVF